MKDLCLQGHQNPGDSKTLAHMGNIRFCKSHIINCTALPGLDSRQIAMGVTRKWAASFVNSCGPPISSSTRLTSSTIPVSWKTHKDQVLNGHQHGC